MVDVPPPPPPPPPAPGSPQALIDLLRAIGEAIAGCCRVRGYSCEAKGSVLRYLGDLSAPSVEPGGQVRLELAVGLVPCTCRPYDSGLDPGCARHHPPAE